MEGIGLDLMDAKALLAKAKRPAVKAVLSTFIREMTAKELDLLGAADGSDDEAENCARPASRSDARARATPRGAASEIASAGAPGEPEAPEPKAPPPSEKCADLLPPAPKRAPPPAAAPPAPAAPAPAFEKASEPALPTDVASPAPTKLVRPAAAAAPSTGNAKDWIVPAYGWEQGEYNSPWVNIMISIDGVGAAKDRSSSAREKSDSTSLRRECSARSRSRESVHAPRPFREMIARPNTIRNQWNMTEI